MIEGQKIGWQIQQGIVTEDVVACLLALFFVVSGLLWIPLVAVSYPQDSHSWLGGIRVSIIFIFIFIIVIFIT